MGREPPRVPSLGPRQHKRASVVRSKYGVSVLRTVQGATASHMHVLGATCRGGSRGVALGSRAVGMGRKHPPSPETYRVPRRTLCLPALYLLRVQSRVHTSYFRTLSLDRSGIQLALLGAVIDIPDFEETG